MEVRRALLAVLLCILTAAPAIAQQDEKKVLEGFNWYDIMGLEPVAVLDSLQAVAEEYAQPLYDRKETYRLLLDLYSIGKKLEKQFPFAAVPDTDAKGYRIEQGRKYAEFLKLDWARLLKLNVRSSMQYILLEVLYTQGIPAAKGKIPAVWTLFEEYFRYYAAIKSLQ